MGNIHIEYVEIFFIVLYRIFIYGSLCRMIIIIIFLYLDLLKWLYEVISFFVNDRFIERKFLEGLY